LQLSSGGESNLNTRQSIFLPDVGGRLFFPKEERQFGHRIILQTPTLPNLLDQFLNRLVESKKFSTIDIVGKTGGSIPCEGPRQTVFQNILLAGDAAGHTHPITGAGILNAVIGGEIAGRAGGGCQETKIYRCKSGEKPGPPHAKKRELKNWNILRLV
jgi:hypothetical protein